MLMMPLSWAATGRQQQARRKKNAKKEIKSATDREQGGDGVLEYEALGAPVVWLFRKRVWYGIPAKE
jgi:hypothetical protein